MCVDVCLCVWPLTFRRSISAVSSCSWWWWGVGGEHSGGGRVHASVRVSHVRRGARQMRCHPPAQEMAYSNQEWPAVAWKSRARCRPRGCSRAALRHYTSPHSADARVRARLMRLMRFLCFWPQKRVSQHLVSAIVFSYNKRTSAPLPADDSQRSSHTS